MKGFTLIELIIVVVIMGVMFIFAVPAFTSTSHSKLKSAVRDVATEMQMARMKAIYRNQSYRVRLILNQTTSDAYIFERYSNGSWETDPERLTMASGATALPFAVDVSGDSVIDFTPTGTSSGGVMCFINKDKADDIVRLTVSSSTGRVKTENVTQCN